MTDRLPSYDELPVRAGAPSGSAWGLWGDDDTLGCLNLLTPERVRAGLACATRGVVFNLNLELELPSPPLFGRSAFRHVVHDASTGHDDELHGFNPQSSTQWDGFRHVRHSVHGFYNAIADTDHGVHHWARRGIAGRAVLVDVGRWRAAQGRPIVGDVAEDPIGVRDLASTLVAQDTRVEVGDILLIRTGWTTWYRALSDEQRTAFASIRVPRCAGLAPGTAMARFLWDLHPAAVAADNPGLELMPPGALQAPEEVARLRNDPDEAQEWFLHFSLLALLGLPIGELFDLDALAEDCAATGGYASFFTSAPLNLSAGVASPPNALAIR